MPSHVLTGMVIKFWQTGTSALNNTPTDGAAELAGCGGGMAAGANWAGPHFRLPELRSASAGSEGASLAAAALLRAAVAPCPLPGMVPRSPPFSVPEQQMRILYVVIPLNTR